MADPIRSHASPAMKVGEDDRADLRRLVVALQDFRDQVQAWRVLVDGRQVNLSGRFGVLEQKESDLRSRVLVIEGKLVDLDRRLKALEVPPV